MNSGQFYLDKEKDIIVSYTPEENGLRYVLRTPNHNTGNLIRNLAKLCHLPLNRDENDLLVIEGVIPCYVVGNNEKIYIFRLGNTKVANIYPDGKVEMKAGIPSISKTLMSQTKNYQLDISKTIIKTYILNELKFHSDLHTHMNANLKPDTLIALGIKHQIQYPLYYVKKLHLKITPKQQHMLSKQRERVRKQFITSNLEGKYLNRRIDDNTYINFADLILNNLENEAYNVSKIRASLAILKDGQAVFTNLEKVYLYRYVFTKGHSVRKRIKLRHTDQIKDDDIRTTLQQMLEDQEHPLYKNNTLFQDKLLWIARTYQNQGVQYVEISDTTLVKKYESIRMLREIHQVMPTIEQETGVQLRFLAALRRVPLTIIKDQASESNNLQDNLNVLRIVCQDPYVVGSDIVGEEVNDIRDLKPVLQEIVKIAKKVPGYVIRIHAGENDGLTDNVVNSIVCVKQALAKNQKMPYIRIGHGLYTPNLTSKIGKELLKELRDENVVLEFQITSNVRLNNLNRLDTHPLKQYLKAGVFCVQGSDGGALYGTDSIDEQLSLEKLLDLHTSDFARMKEVETRIIKESQKNFLRKTKQFERKRKGRDLGEYLLDQMNAKEKRSVILSKQDGIDVISPLRDQIQELPWDRMPIVIAGGSFGNKKQTTVSSTDKKHINKLLEVLNPQEVFFVVGHTMTGQEKYLIDHNKKGFQIFAIVPAVLKKSKIQQLKRSKVFIRVSTERFAMGVYKSFNYEIFERRPSIVIAFDGNLTGANLIQEAKNGKGKAYIFVNEKAPILKEKAESLQGYVTLFKGRDAMPEAVAQHVKDTLK